MRTIADIGSNFITLDDCLQAVKHAKKDGIDFLKFQKFTHARLYGFSGQMKGEITRAWLPKIASACRKAGIGFMCSVFHLDDVQFIDDLVDMHKIASAEAGWNDLIDACQNDLAKPVLVSTGCMNRQEIDSLICTGVVPMACIAEYPSKSIPIEALISFKRNECFSYGYSCHNPKQIYVEYEIAQRFDCDYFEFHYNPLMLKTVDSGHSVSRFEKPIVKPYTPNKTIARRQTRNGFYRVKG